MNTSNLILKVPFLGGLWPLQQIAADVIECSYLLFFYLRCICVVLLNYFLFLLLLLLWNKHWLFNSKGCSIKEYEQKHAFLTDCSTVLKKEKKKNLVSWSNAQPEIIKLQKKKKKRKLFTNRCHVKFDTFFLPCKNRSV